MTSNQNSPTPAGLSSSKGRSARVLLWSGGALLLALIILFDIWLVRSSLRNHPDAAGATEVQRYGATTAGNAEYALADSISIILSNPVMERGIRLLPTADGVTTPDAVEGVECHKLMESKTAYAYFSIDPSFKQT